MGNLNDTIEKQISEKIKIYKKKGIHHITDEIAYHHVPQSKTIFEKRMKSICVCACPATEGSTELSFRFSFFVFVVCCCVCELRRERSELHCRERSGR